MNKAVEELVERHLGKYCPECGERTLTVPGMMLIKEGSMWGYDTFRKRCLDCGWSSQSVKVHQKWQKIQTEQERELYKETDGIRDITPKFNDSWLSKIIQWLTSIQNK